jgi:hypothetical protein
VDLAQLSRQLLAVVNETMQPAHAALWLRPPERHEGWRVQPNAAAPSLAANAVSTVTSQELLDRVQRSIPAFSDEQEPDRAEDPADRVRLPAIPTEREAV